MIGLIGGLALLIILTMRGVNILIAGPVSALFVALMSGMPLFPQLAGEGEANFVTSYMTGFTGFIMSWYLMFLLGAVFGKVMEDSGAADAVAKWFVEKLGMKFAVISNCSRMCNFDIWWCKFVRSCLLCLSDGNLIV